MRYLNKWGGNRADEFWAEKNQQMLLEKHLDHYVVIINDYVLESAVSEDELIEYLHVRRLPLFLPLIKKVSLPPPKPEIAQLLEQEASEELVFSPGLC